jgi:hypothetical protein
VAGVVGRAALGDRFVDGRLDELDVLEAATDGEMELPFRH